MQRVTIIQRRLTHYRVPLFVALKDELAARNIMLDLLVGRGTPEEDKKQDTGKLPWAKHIPTKYWLNGQLCWQSIGRHLSGADLVIVTQENKLLRNHLMMLAPRRYKLAFWGHGANLQSHHPHGIKERFKRWTTTSVDWWFAYTERSANLVRNVDFPSNRITVLNNTVDTSELQRHRLLISQQDSLALRQKLDFTLGPVGVYVGSFYAEKRLDFLFAAAEAIRCEIPDFQLLLVGDGPDREKVLAWCRAKPWIRWVGAKFGCDKVAYMSIAQVMLNPGAVGLGILDSFVCGMPMLTTNCGGHGPEIAYLEQGKNGIMTAFDIDAYASACVMLLRDPKAIETLTIGCATSAREYTLENMVARFTNGIEESLRG